MINPITLRALQRETMLFIKVRKRINKLMNGKAFIWHPKNGWQDAEWVGTVKVIPGKKATIKMSKFYRS